MAETRSIRVKQVRAADRGLSLTLEIVDGGDFPHAILVGAGMHRLPDVMPYFGFSELYEAPASPLNVSITFAEADHIVEPGLNYAITLYNWDGAGVEKWSGSYNGTDTGLLSGGLE